jgi:hypothetical protein
MAMDNPYRAPEAEIRPVGIKSVSREDLWRVAQAQRFLMLCIVAMLSCLAVMPAIPTLLGTEIATLFYLATILAGAGCTFALAMRMYSTSVAILVGVLTLIPCFGLIYMLRMNQRAAAFLRDNGINVGFLGANMSQFSGPSDDDP